MEKLLWVGRRIGRHLSLLIGIVAYADCFSVCDAGN